MDDRFLLTVLLFILLAAGVGCSAGGGEGEATAAPVPTTAPLAATAPPSLPPPTSTSTSTAAPTATTAPTASAAPTSPTVPAAPAVESLLSSLRNGGYVIYFRHAATDPVPDDTDPVDLSDCGTQRNLSAEGRSQAATIGQAFNDLAIPVGRVLSSPFCRALETARLAFGKATPEPSLENLETAESEAERASRIEDLRRLLSTQPEGATNSILVGHGFNISAAADVALAEGEAAVFHPEGKGGFMLVATVPSSGWEALTAALAGSWAVSPPGLMSGGSNYSGSLLSWNLSAAELMQ